MRSAGWAGDIEGRRYMIGIEHRFDKHRGDVTTDLAIKELDETGKSDRPFMFMMSDTKVRTVPK
jgi:hypothetical protein